LHNEKYAKALEENYTFGLNEIHRVPEIKLAYKLLNILEVTLGAVGSRLYYQLFKQVDKIPSYRVLLVASKPLKKFLKNSQGKRSVFTSIADLSITERRQLLHLLDQSSLAFHRRLSLSMKAFYSGMIYRGEVGNLIAKVDNLPQVKANNLPSVPEVHFSTHLKLNSKKHELQGEIDYLIIGSGVAGSILAHELYLAGKNVVVLEKGSFIQPSLYNARNINQHLRNSGVVTNSSGDTLVAMAQVAGGGSSVNYDLAFPVSHLSVLNHFKEWREAGLVSKSIFTEENLMRANSYVSNKIGVRTVSESEINNNNRKLQIGARALGRESTLMQLTTLSPEDMQKPENKDRATDKRSGLEVFLMPAMKDYKQIKKPVSLIVDVGAEKIIFDGNKAVGVEFKSYGNKSTSPLIKNDLYGFSFESEKKYRIYANNIILTAGAVGTTYLLKNSGIKNKNVGKGFVIHPVIPLVGRFDTIQDHYLGTQSSVYIGDQLKTKSNEEKDDYLIETSIYPVHKIAMAVPGSANEILEYIKDYRKMTGAGVILIDKPNPKNQIEFKRGKDDVVVKYQLSNSDKARFVKGIAGAAKILLASGAKEVILSTTEYYLSPDQRPIIRNNADIEMLEKNLKLNDTTMLILSGHIMSANKMGSHPDNSVIDHHFKVWGRESLYIADASIFPTSVGANPMMSIYTTSYLFAHHLLKLSTR
jgi:choline dehydrogenase-like flavoprotein